MRLWTLLLCVALFFSCSTPPQEGATTATPSQAQIPEDEARACGEQLARALSESDTEAIGRAMDYNLFLERLLDGVDVKAEFKKGFREGFLGRLKETPAGLFTATLGQRAKIIKVHQKDGRTRVLMRVLIGTAPAALTYLDLEVTRNDAGQVVIDDFYSYATGERISETLRRTLLPVMANLSKTPLQKLIGGGGNVFADNFQEVIRMGQSVQAGQHKEALEIFKSFPKEVQNRKFVLLLYIQAAAEQSDDLYKDALERLRTHHPNDPSLRVHEIDYFLLSGELDKVIPAIDALEEGLGVEDPYLNVMRASACLEQKNFEKGAEWARVAIKKEPEVEEGYWALVNLSIESKDYKSVVEGLEGLDSIYPNLRQEADGDPAYAEFLASPEGKKWQAGKGS